MHCTEYIWKCHNRWRMSCLECTVCNAPSYLLIFLYHIHAKVLDQEGSIHNPHKKLSHLYYVQGTETRCIDLLPTKYTRKLKCSHRDAFWLNKILASLPYFCLNKCYGATCKPFNLLVWLLFGGAHYSGVALKLIKI